MKTTQDLITDYLSKDKKKWISGGEMERRLSAIYKPATISRVLRSMAEDELIYKDYKKDYKVRYVIYKFKKNG